MSALKTRMENWKSDWNFMEQKEKDLYQQCESELAALNARIEKLAEYPERLQKAITELRALITPTLSRSEQYRIAGKIDGIKIALSYFEETSR